MSAAGIYYDTPEKIAAVDAEARSWIGTPFMENSAVKGMGVSCHFLAAAIYRATGFLPSDFTPPRGSVRRFGRGPALAMLQFVDAALGDRFARLPLTSALAPGDLLVGAHEKRAKHIGIVLPAGYFVHVLTDYGVLLSRLDDATYSELVAIRRPLAPVSP